MEQNRQKLEDVESRLKGIKESMQLSQEEAEKANQQFLQAQESVKGSSVEQLQTKLKTLSSQRGELTDRSKSLKQK